MKRWLLLLPILLLGCGAPQTAQPTPNPTATPLPITLPDGFAAEVLPYRLDRPTQFLLTKSALWVAELNGGENDEMGQVVQIDLASGEKTAVLTNLDKPTGIAILDGMLWVATRDAILQAPLDDPAAVTVVLANLPNNGRSNGTLTPTPNGKLLFETSGNRRDANSGKLWELDPQTGMQQALASGLKGAYAHVFDENGRLWITEIVDGTFNDEPLPDEVNLVVENANFGWPTCFGRELYGPNCDDVRPAVAVLPPHSTPTSIVRSPFRQNTLLVALWVTGEIVQISLNMNDNNASGSPRPFITGFRNPQHMIVAPDGSLWVSDYGLGILYRIYRL